MTRSRWSTRSAGTSTARLRNHRGLHRAEATAAIESAARGSNPFAAILSDLQLPDGDGRTIVKLAREKLPKCPVVIMTGSRSVSGSVEAMRLGAVTVLEKPGRSSS